MGNYLILNDVNSNTITGLLIQNLPPISKPRQRVNIEEIDGRDGDIITPLGYGAYDKEFQIGLSYNYDVDEIIKYFDSEGKVTFSNEPDKYYNYKIIEQIDFEKLIRFKTANVKMHVQPFKYANNEEAITDEFDPITAEGKSMSLNNTVPNTFNEFSIHGNSEQGSTTGKNKLKINQAAGTINGITYTIKEDKSIIINGTATADSVWVMENAAQLNSDLIVGQSYILSGCQNGSTTTYRLQVYNVEGTQQVKYDIGNGVQFNYVETTSANVAILVKANVTVNNVTIKPMIRLASVTDETYEPYTGGQASPNPSYPQDIHSTGDNVNLFDITTAINGYIGANGAVSVNDDWKLSQHIEVKNNSSYTMSRSDGTRQSFVIAEYDENKTFIKRNEQGLQPVGVNSPYTITTGATTKYIRINYNNTFQATTIKLEKGTAASPYTPYGMGSVNEKVQNKNLININNWVKGRINNSTGEIEYANNTTAMTISNNSITFTVSQAWNSGIASDFIPITLGEYYFKYSHDKKVTVYADTYNSQKERISRIMSYTEDSSPTTRILTISDSSIRYIRIHFEVSTVDTYVVSDIQLEQGTTATDYVAHEEQNISIPTQQPMRAIGDYKDTFVKVDGNWYERHYIGQKIFDGSESGWSLQSINSSGIANYFYSLLTDYIGDSNNLAYTNYFSSQITTIGNTTNEGYFLNGAKQLYIRIKSSTAGALADFKTWLSNNNVELIYVLATPVDLPCTEEQTQVLESKKHSYDGQTHISSLDATPAHMNVAVNGDTSLTVRNEGNIYSKPVFTISGSGDISMYLNNSQVFEISLGDEEYITIDIDKMEAYKGEVLKNRLVKGNYENCVLETGDNTISFTGAVTGIEISNYSRWI